MSLKARIQEDVKNAMRAHEREQLAALRLLTAAIKQKEVDERIELNVSVDEYNADVDEKQREHGKLDTIEPIGTRIQWGAWEQAV